MNPVRVLFVSGGSLDYGGISSWMLSYAAEFDRNLVAVDFLVHDLVPGAREADALALGAKVYHVPFRGKQPLANQRGIERAIGAWTDALAHLEVKNSRACPTEEIAAQGYDIHTAAKSLQQFYQEAVNRG